MTVYSDTLTDGLTWHGSQNQVRGVGISAGFSLHAAPTYRWAAGIDVHEHFKFSPVALGLAKFGVTLPEAWTLSALLETARPEFMEEDLGFSDALRIAYGISIVQKLRFQDSRVTTTHFGLVLAQALRLSDSLGNFFGGTLADHVGMHSTLIPLYQATAALQSSVGLGSLLGASLFLRLELDDGLDLSDANILNMIYQGDPLLDGIKIVAAYVEPSGSFTTWAVNTRTNAVTEYQNYVFNSFTQMGNQFLGANSDGLWVLTGEQDDDQNIWTRIKSGILQIGSSHFTSFKAAYLGLRVKDDARDFVLRLEAGDGREYFYAVRPQNMMTTKVNMGKGLRSRYFSFELLSYGPDYDFDSIEFVPIVTQRRV